MLSKFTVSNFKGFNSEFIFDLGNSNGYGFNTNSVKNNIAYNALVYGHNGVGKSNLGLAIFDIVKNLSDRNIVEQFYKHYLNAQNTINYATFHYTFSLNSGTVIYEYDKKNSDTILRERLILNDEIVASIDRSKSSKALINLAGAETLNTDLPNENLSLLRYIKNNSQLNQELAKNKLFFELFEFVERMLFFRSLNQNMYLGLETGSGSVMQDIIDRGNLHDLESFLKNAGIECKLKVIPELDNEVIAFDFGNRSIPFYKIASTGTKALTLFYFWLQRIRSGEVKFLFIDEFDAFYHHELSAMIVEELIKTDVQFILTSHNTSIITNDLLRPDCYFLMNSKKIKSLANSTPKELREAHNIEKMYKAGSFDVG